MELNLFIVIVIVLISILVWIFGMWLVASGVKKNSMVRIILGMIFSGIVWGLIVYIIATRQVDRRNRHR